MLLVFSDDWGRHPSSCQHLVQRLLPRHKVLWVNTIGMRVPGLNLGTIRRGFEKIWEWSQSAQPGRHELKNPLVLRPRMWPWFGRRHDRWLNEKLLVRAIEPALKSAGEPVFAVTTIPIVADLLDRLSVEHWTYYCVDDFSVWPGLDQQTMARMERDLLQQCDEVIAVSENLVDHIASQGKSAHLLPHGVDLEFWRSLQPSGLTSQLAHLEQPLVVFWGVIDRRMNVEWVRQLAADLTQGTILLVGRLDDPDPALLAIDRVVHLPPLALQQLPELGQMADVLIMPYADLPVTRAMQPLKLLEYLATGKPVIASDLPAVRPWANCLDVAGSAASFSHLVRARIGATLPQDQVQARERLSHESWDAKAVEFEEYVLGRHSPEPTSRAASLVLQN